MTSIFLIAILVMVPLSGQAQELQSPKMKGSAVLETTSEKAAKIQGYAVLSNDNIIAVKTNGWAVMSSDAVVSSKLSGWIVLENITRFFYRTPLTHFY